MQTIATTMVIALLMEYANAILDGTELLVNTKYALQTAAAMEFVKTINVFASKVILVLLAATVSTLQYLTN